MRSTLKLIKEDARNTYITNLRYAIMEQLNIYQRNLVMPKQFSIEFCSYVMTNDSITSKTHEIENGFNLFPNIDYQKAANNIKEFYMNSIVSYSSQDNVYVIEGRDQHELIYPQETADSGFSIIVGEEQIGLSRGDCAVIRYDEKAIFLTVFNIINFMSQLGDVYDSEQKMITTKGGRFNE